MKHDQIPQNINAAAYDHGVASASSRAATKKLQGLKPSAGRFRAVNLGYENAKSAFLGFLMIFDFCSFGGILKRLNSHGESLFRCSRKMEFAWNKKNGWLYVHFWHVQRNSVYAHTLPQSRYPSHIPGPLEITCLHVATRSSKRPCEHWQGSNGRPQVCPKTPPDQTTVGQCFIKVLLIQRFLLLGTHCRLFVCISNRPTP